MLYTGAKVILKVLLCISLSLASNQLIASDYSPPGLYDVDATTLDNGIDVIFKQRQTAHTFSMRVWVGIGTQDFPCKSQEIPHFLEHLLFTGTTKHSEVELEHLVADHGGYWNAATGVEETTYQIDIYSRYAEFAIDMLHEIITDSTITAENVEISRDIIHRESGGEPSAIRRWFRDRGVGVNATIKAVRQLVPDTNLVCESLVTATDISRDQIIDTFEKFYVPGNMAVIIVGDFDRDEVLQQLRRTFGKMPVKPVPERLITGIEESLSFDPVTGTLSPLISDDANIGIMYRLPGYWSEDHYPMMVLEEYLHYRISEVIRMERGLAYAPDTWSYRTDRFGLFGVYADVNIDDIDDALFLINREMRMLTEHYLSEESLERSKLKILLRSVRGYESNSEFAGYYSAQYVLFRKNRTFENVEQKIEAVTLEDIERVVKKYLSKDKAVTIFETPTLTLTQLYVLLSVLFLAAILFVMYVYIKLHVRFKKSKTNN